MHITWQSSKGTDVTNAGMKSCNSENSVILTAWFYVMPHPFPGTYTMQELTTGIHKLRLNRAISTSNWAAICLHGKIPVFCIILCCNKIPDLFQRLRTKSVCTHMRTEKYRIHEVGLWIPLPLFLLFPHQNHKSRSLTSFPPLPFIIFIFIRIWIWSSWKPTGFMSVFTPSRRHSKLGWETMEVNSVLICDPTSAGWIILLHPTGIEDVSHESVS